jgi:dihydrofolate synthase/folylpolyglutamate synthase
MTYSEAVAFLYNLRLFGTKLGLENSFELARLNGNPHEKLRFVHVAGTNGKGSTCAILESIYRARGLKTGLFTSPHLVSFTERLQVNRVAIAESDVARLTGTLIDSLGGPDAEKWALRPTFFEFVTIMALLYFAEQKCELVIWETGMGGRLDATNVVTPLASVITNIQHDHQHWLGHTLEQIAAEKAGIIKRGIPIFTATPVGPALEVIRAIATQQGAPLTVISPNDKPLPQFSEILTELPLLGTHQRLNATLALSVCSALSGVIPVSADAMHRGISTVSWPGRLQLIHRGNSQILIDGAHNPDGAKSLATALTHNFPQRPLTLILGLFRDKSWREMCDVLVPLAARVLLVPLSTERTADPDEVQAYCSSKFAESQILKCESLAAALQISASDDFIVIAGSLHLIGEAMEKLKVSTSSHSERALNEWDASNATK